MRRKSSLPHYYYSFFFLLNFLIVLLPPILFHIPFLPLFFPSLYYSSANFLRFSLPFSSSLSSHILPFFIFLFLFLSLLPYPILPFFCISFSSISSSSPAFLVLFIPPIFPVTPFLFLRHLLPPFLSSPFSPYILSFTSSHYCSFPPPLHSSPFSPEV